MVKITKIGLIREELSRIASVEDRMDPVAPTMMASWSFTRVMIIGKLKMQAFDFDFLQEIFKKAPDGVGEAKFWLMVDSAYFKELMLEPKRDCEVVQLSDHQQTQKALA